jgi:hypothetical protein
VLLGGGGGKPLKLTGGQELRSVGVPVGTILPWIHGTPPPGWLLCDGAAFSATAYPELAAMITTGKTPDLRGAYLRGAGASAAGWGAAGNLPGASQGDSTKMPNAPFTATTDNQGAHTHTYISGWGDGSGIHGGAWAAGELGYRSHTNTTSSDGNHAHTVTVAGGDPETRPKSFFVNWILKATDSTITLVP